MALTPVTPQTPGFTAAVAAGAGAFFGLFHLLHLKLPVSPLPLRLVPGPSLASSSALRRPPG
nr:hypothetical protein [Phycobacter azelaicus]